MTIFGHQTAIVILSVVQLLMVLLSSSSAQTVADCFRTTVPEQARGIVCDVRQYRVPSGDEADRYISCALEAVRFVGSDGSVQRNVVLSALDAVETHDGVYTDSVDACLSKTRKQPGTERPRAFFSCMLATESAQNFKDALELQELKAGGQWAEGETFERAKVQQLIGEVNGKVQCK